MPTSPPPNHHRAGQSFRVLVTCDSWLDSAGTPWAPNQTPNVSIPAVSVNDPPWSSRT